MAFLSPEARVGTKTHAKSLHLLSFLRVHSGHGLVVLLLLGLDVLNRQPHAHHARLLILHTLRRFLLPHHRHVVCHLRLPLNLREVFRCLLGSKSLLGAQTSGFLPANLLGAQGGLLDGSRDGDRDGGGRGDREAHVGPGSVLGRDLSRLGSCRGGGGDSRGCGRGGDGVKEVRLGLVLRSLVLARINVELKTRCRLTIESPTISNKSTHEHKFQTME